MNKIDTYLSVSDGVKVKVAVLNYDGAELVIPDARSLIDILGVGEEDIDGSIIYKLYFKEITCKEFNEMPEFTGF